MRILLPIDGSNCSQQTLNWVCSTLNLPDNVFYLLMVINPIPEFEIQDAEIEAAKTILAQARSQLETQGARVASSQESIGMTLPEIIRCVREQDIDQVILGSHGRSGLAKLLLGSTSAAVLEHCPCEVIIYKP